MSILTFEIPMLPPSVNHYVEHVIRWKNGAPYVAHIKTAAAEKFGYDFGYFVRGACVTGDRFRAEFHYYLGPGDRGDWDNFNKCLGDAIADSGMLRDRKGKELTDAKIKLATVHIHDSEEDRKQGPKTRITLEAIPR